MLEAMVAGMLEAMVVEIAYRPELFRKEANRQAKRPQQQDKCRRRRMYSPLDSGVGLTVY